MVASTGLRYIRNTELELQVLLTFLDMIQSMAWQQAPTPARAACQVPRDRAVSGSSCPIAAGSSGSALQSRCTSQNFCEVRCFRDVALLILRVLLVLHENCGDTKTIIDESVKAARPVAWGQDPCFCILLVSAPEKVIPCQVKDQALGS